MTGSYATQASTRLYKNTHEAFKEIDTGSRVKIKSITIIIKSEVKSIYIKLRIKMKNGIIGSCLQRYFTIRMEN